MLNTFVEMIINPPLLTHKPTRKGPFSWADAKQPVDKLTHYFGTDHAMCNEIELLSSAERTKDVVDWRDGSTKESRLA
jgi:hypothetical protein